MQNNLIIQKLQGYQNHYLLLGGKEPKLLDRDSINKSIEAIKNELQLQYKILDKMDQLDKQSQQNKPETK